MEFIIQFVKIWINDSKTNKKPLLSDILETFELDKTGYNEINN